MVKIPTGVKVISVLYYIAAALLLLIGLILTIASKPMTEALVPLASQMGIPFLATIGIGVVIAMGLTYILFAVLEFFIAKGLWNAKNWARIIVIIFAIMGFLSGISQLFRGAYGVSIASLVLNGLIGGYLLFSKEVKRAFS